MLECCFTTTTIVCSLNLLLSVNYLLESYGLSSFQQFPVKRKTLEDRIKETPVLPIHGSSKTKKWIAAAAVFVPLAILTIWIPTKYDLVEQTLIMLI
jgi:hypothetical protein